MVKCPECGSSIVPLSSKGIVFCKWVCVKCDWERKAYE